MATEFNSPISRKRMAEANAPKQYVVPSDQEEGQADEMFDSNFENKVKMARKDKAEGIERLTPNAKKRIELLSNIGRLYKEVDIDGTIFSLRTLKSKEIAEVAINVLNYSNEFQAVFESRKHYLSRSLYKIDGMTIESILEENTQESKMTFIEELNETVVSKLMKEYDLLADEAKVKYGITTVEQAKEVAEDLKK